MSYLKSFGQFVDSFGLNPDELVINVLLISALIFVIIWGFCLGIRKTKGIFHVLRNEDKNLPESFSVTTTDGAHMTLERDWIDGEWRYVLAGSLPYRWGPVERDHLKIPECLKDKPEERWLKNLDAFTRSPEYDAAVEARYGKRK